MLEATQGAAAPVLPSEPANPEAAQPNAATTDAATGAVDGGEASQAAPKTFTQQELDEIVSKRVKKAESQTERRVLRTLEKFAPQHQSAPQQNSQPANDGKPSRSQYANDEQYIEAVTDWKLDQRDNAAKVETQRKQQATLQQKTEAIYAEAEKLPGFDRESFDDLPLTRPIVEALIESDAPAKLMHYMAANPAELERIAKLSPARQAAELGKLEAKAVEAKPPARSNAPTALAPARGSGSGQAAMPDPSNTKAYIAWANAEERAARR